MLGSTPNAINLDREVSSLMQYFIIKEEEVGCYSIRNFKATCSSPLLTLSLTCIVYVQCVHRTEGKAMPSQIAFDGLLHKFVFQ